MQRSIRPQHGDRFQRDNCILFYVGTNFICERLNGVAFFLAFRIDIFIDETMHRQRDIKWLRRRMAFTLGHLLKHQPAKFSKQFFNIQIRDGT